MLKEFKEFAMKGNVLDLAIGVVIGAAFQAIINSLVSDIIMPVVSLFTGKVDFSDLAIKVGGSSINYGNFITALVNFLIIAFSIFLFVKYINKLNKMGENLAKNVDKKVSKKLKKGHQESEPVVSEPETKICPYCLTEIKYKATRCPNCTSELEKIASEIIKEKMPIE
jgi:large conductance mechanosensitive channel